MSSMAKIFVVVNLILAVMAFGSAATLLGAKEDYKAALLKAQDDHEAYVSNMEKKVNDLDIQLSQQTNKASQALANERATATENETVKRDLASTRTANEKLRASVETLSQEVKALRTVQEKAQASIDTMTKESRQATTDKLDAVKKYEEEVGNRVRLEREVANMQEAIDTLKAEMGDLRAANRNLKFENDAYRKRHGTIVDAPKGSDGRVLEVKTGEFGILVGISVGSEDGVRAGDVYNIRRGAAYVGRMTVDKVYKGQSVGLFDNKFPGSAAPPQKGDTAYANR